MKVLLIPLTALLALWLSGCQQGPMERDIKQQLAIHLAADLPSSLFDLTQLTIIEKNRLSDELYQLTISYQLHFKLGLAQLFTLTDEDVIYNDDGPLQKNLDLMALEQAYGAFESGQVIERKARIWVVQQERGWQLTLPPTTPSSTHPSH